MSIRDNTHSSDSLPQFRLWYRRSLNGVGGHDKPAECDSINKVFRRFLVRHLLLVLLTIIGPAAFADETQRDADFAVTVVDHLQRPIADAVVLAPTGTKDELKIFRTNTDGVTTLPSLTTASCSLEVSAEGFRETLWKGKPNVAQTIVMLPIIAGRVLDNKEQPIMDAWLTSEPVVFSKTGLPEFPVRTVSDAGQNWSYREGKFRLKSPHVATSLLGKDSELLLPLFVLERTHHFGQFHFLPLSDLDKLLELKLQPLVHVEATYTFNGRKPPRTFRWIITDKEQRTLAEIRAAIRTNIYETSATLNCILPAGEYELHCIDMIPEHEPVVIPVKLSGEVRSLKLNEQDVEPHMVSESPPEFDQEPETPLFKLDDIEAPKGNWGTIYGRIIGDRFTVRHRPATMVNANPQCESRRGRFLPKISR
ncbi:MAG: carboxypeptidase-like regulatory domain-containing protein [Planctomycetaceae bacterium]